VNSPSWIPKCSFPLLSFSAQPPPAYSHPSTASYSVQQAPAVAHAVTASYSPASVQAARPVVTAPYPIYQSHQAPPDYAYRQPDPPAPPQPTTTPQTYQVYPETVSRVLLPLYDMIWYSFICPTVGKYQQQQKNIIITSSHFLIASCSHIGCDVKTFTLGQIMWFLASKTLVQTATHASFVPTFTGFVLYVIKMYGLL